MATWRDGHPLSYLRNGDETRRDELVILLHSIKKIYTTHLPESAYTKSDPRGILTDIDEVYPGIYIGDAGIARDRDTLKRMGITHVLNTAEGNRFGCVNTNQNYYSIDTSIIYKGLKLIDLPTTNISVYFAEAAQFIEEALVSGGKILVHCLMGMSRSGTCVLAFLMLKRGMTASEAIEQVRTRREIRPNDGFIQQLAALDNVLRRQRQRSNNE